MKQIIKLTGGDETVFLQQGLYKIFITGGYSVSLPNNFKITLTDIETNEEVKLKNTLRIRSNENGIKAVRLYSFEVKKGATFKISIANGSKVVVKRSMLWSRNLISGNVNLNDCYLGIDNL